MTAFLEATDLFKKFDQLIAVDGISLSVAQGEVLGFLGPNGAGKSTTMRMLAGYLTPTSGTAQVKGLTVTDGSVDARRAIGYLPEGAPLYGDMRTEDFLSFIAASHGLTGASAATAIANTVSAVHLDEVLHQRIETLSKGYKRRVGLAAAILHEPDVLILDEPTDGLDPNQKFEVRRLIESMAKDRAIIISTHILEEVEALCTRAVIINQGKIVADGTPSALKAKSKYRNALTMQVDEKKADAIAADIKGLEKVDGVEIARHGKEALLTVIAVGQFPIADDVAGLVAEKGWHVSQFSVDGGRLDDVFRAVTKGEAA